VRGNRQTNAHVGGSSTQYLTFPTVPCSSVLSVPCWPYRHAKRANVPLLELKQSNLFPIKQRNVTYSNFGCYPNVINCDFNCSLITSMKPVQLREL
jgi:hypothetical protein